jgi:MFS transporter, SP family, galactose:H+ symporter
LGVRNPHIFAPGDYMLEPKHNMFVMWVAGLVSIGGILYGYDIGVISGALLFIKNSITMNDTQIGYIVGAVLAGSLFGTIVAGPVGDKFGRKFLIAAAAVIFIVGIFLVLMATSFITMFCARLLLGTAIGMIAVAVPLYVAEIVSSRDRGKYMTLFQLFLTFGIVAAYFVDLIFTPSGNWRGMFAVLLIPASILFFGILILPETPRWLMAQNQSDKARKVLFKIRNHADDVDHEMRAITASLHHVRGSWREFLTPKFLTATFTAVSIAVFNQLTGINSFLQYAALILKNAGMDSNEITMMGSVGIGLLNFIFTIVAITLIDSLGRRPLLLAGVSGVLISEIYLGFITYFIPQTPLSGMLILAGLLVFIASFAIGPGVVVWLAISELFPTKVRGKGIAICLFFNSLAATILSVYFLPLVKFLGMGATYWLFALFSLGYFLIVLFCLPETKSRTLEEIQLSFENQ